MNRSPLIGSLLFINLIIQLITGLLLSCYYNSYYLIAFNSVCHIIHDIESGWLIRVIHIIGSSLFMLFLLLHYIRGYYRITTINSGYGIISYYIGLFILLLSLITSFIGYTSNWGQMSYWGMTVIISILHSIPIIGDYISVIIWPSYIIGISRLFTIHFIIGYIMCNIIFIHIIILHAYSSSNTLINSMSSLLFPFYCYFFKDVSYMSYLLYIINCLLLIEPDILGNCDNNLIADPFTTPHNILPEWYSSSFHCTSRSYPSKNIGVIIVIILFIILFIIVIHYSE